MNDWCKKLKSKLEKTFSMPFDVSMSEVDGEELYVCCPHNAEEQYFVVKAYIHDQIRLVVEANPQKNAGSLLYTMANADECKKKIFFQYIEVLSHEKAKVQFYVNNQLVTSQEQWPDVWRYFNCRIVILPIPEVKDESELLNILSDWMLHGVSLVMSLLTIEETASDMELIAQQEGNVKEILSKRYERSRINREICLAHKGYSCSVCGFNFLTTYGQLGKDFIEVHHTTPVSEMGDNYTIDIDRDLVPVCSNCHAMIHRKRPPLTIEELKAMIAKKSSDNSQIKKSHNQNKNAVETRLMPEGSILQAVDDDNDVRILIHNMMELYEGTTILHIVTECQREFQQKYFSMKAIDWRHLIRDYVRNVTARSDLQEEEVFRFSMAG